MAPLRCDAGASMRESPAAESRTPSVVYVDADLGQLRLFEAAFSDRFRLTLSSSAGELLERVDAVAPVAALLADHATGHDLLEAAPPALADTERLLVARTRELPAARAAVERGAAKRCFVKPWVPGELGAALEDAVRIFELRSQLRTLRTRLDQSERLATLGRVSAGIAHELAGPAAYVAENASALRRELAGVAAYVRRVNRIRPDARVLERLRELGEIVQDVEAGAEHVRQVSRGFTGQLRAEAPVERCDVATVVQHVVRLVRPELRGRATLSVLGGSLEVRASPLRLTQVLINLVVNASQAVSSMQRTKVGNLKVRWIGVGGLARIEVIDDGPGLPEQVDRGESELLFSTKPPESGTGLGLSLCRELVAEMGGTLTLRSMPGRGTCALLQLPLDR
ncbi:MAG TPA: HAMP domain-containing sensor histidine kinase [Myxococcaceae bacterium]|nr:HAMP domain-containing sensor histidine kinase [Myxococcaceae bacterium]